LDDVRVTRSCRAEGSSIVIVPDSFVCGNDLNLGDTRCLDSLSGSVAGGVYVNRSSLKSVSPTFNSAYMRVTEAPHLDSLAGRVYGKTIIESSGLSSIDPKFSSNELHVINCPNIDCVAGRIAEYAFFSRNEKIARFDPEFHCKQLGLWDCGIAPLSLDGSVEGDVHTDRGNLTRSENFKLGGSVWLQRTHSHVPNLSYEPNLTPAPLSESPLPSPGFTTAAQSSPGGFAR